MKYKRRKPTVSSHISQQKADAPGKKRSALHRRAVAAGVVILTVFSLTRTGIVEENTVKRFLDLKSSEGMEYIRSESAKNFLDKLGSLTAEFCFGYLRSEKTDGKAYAVDNSKDVKSEKTADDIEIMSDVQINSDSEAIAENSPPEPEKFEPVMPCVGNISSPYGQRVHPITGAVTNHNGVDVACSEGTYVGAVFDGTVEKSEYNQYSGNLIVIRHIDGFTSSYAHLSERLVSVGQSVTTGSKIGRSGSTGMVTGPHLHFEIRQSGTAVNPFDYISGD